MYKRLSVLKLQKADKRNQRQPKSMESHIMFMNWKTQHSKDDTGKNNRIVKEQKLQSHKSNMNWK